MRIGTTYLVNILKYGYPPKVEDDFKGFELLGKLGFHYMEMEGLGREHAAHVRQNVNEYRRALADSGIHIHNFCVVDPALTSLDAKEQEQAFSNFQQMVEIGLLLGTETFHLASYAPPVHYNGRVPYALDGGEYVFGPQARVTIPDDFSWPHVWENLVRSCQRCADYVATFGKILLMEPRIGEVICSVDSMLRLLEYVDRPNLKANFDVGHFSAQRENVSLALMKLEGKFANIHIADNRPTDTDHLAIGCGDVDWQEFFRILKRMDYQGYLGLDLGARTDEELISALLASREKIRQYCEEAEIAIEW